MEYRIYWNASSNISFHGATDWQEWENEDETDEEIQDVMHNKSDYGSIDAANNFPTGLEIALEASGFEWWVETR